MTMPTGRQAGQGGHMEAKKVFHHDDPPCRARLDGRFCQECKIHPDMQSLAIYYYCPNCDVQLKNMVCPQCQATCSLPADPVEWTCDECKETGDTASCSRPEYCAASRAQAIEAADLLRKQKLENGE